MTFTGKNCLSVKNSTVLTASTHETGKIFSFNGTIDVQVVIINDEPWFVAVDVCNALGLQNPTARLKEHLCKDEYMTYIVYRTDINHPTKSVGVGSQRTVNVVNESGLYTLIFQSRKLIAKTFRKWITSEVLPSIRKTGKYELKPDTKEIEHYKAEAERWKDNCKLIKECYDTELSSANLLYEQYKRLETFKHVVQDAIYRY